MWCVFLGRISELGKGRLEHGFEKLEKWKEILVWSYLVCGTFFCSELTDEEREDWNTDLKN